MPNGIFLIGWDNTIGPFVEQSYPPDSKLDITQVIQYLATIQALGSSNIIQISDENRTVLVYGIPSKENGPVNYNFLVLLLNKDEQELSKHFQFLLMAKGRSIINTSKIESKRQFMRLANKIFNPLTQKIIFIGQPDAGKTSTKLFLFEKMMGNKLLNMTTIPTQGFEVGSYKFIDLNISLFDTSGQEINRWITESDEIFENSDLIIYFFSVTDWGENRAGVQENIKKLNKTLAENQDFRKNFIIFCHKIDLIGDLDDGFKNNVREFTDSLEIPVYFTSIKNGGNRDLFKGIQLILNKFSEFLNIFNNLLNSIIIQFNYEPVVLLDSQHKIIINYEINSDFPVFSNIEEIKQYFPQFFFTENSKQKENSSIFSFWLPYKNIALICLEVKPIYPDISYLFLKGGSFEKFNEFRLKYLEMLRSMNWKIENF